MEAGLADHVWGLEELAFRLARELSARLLDRGLGWNRALGAVLRGASNIGLVHLGTCGWRDY